MGVSVSGGGPAWNTPESPSRARLLAPQSRAAAENGSDRSQDENSEAAEGGRARGALLGGGGGSPPLTRSRPPTDAAPRGPGPLGVGKVCVFGKENSLTVSM